MCIKIFAFCNRDETDDGTDLQKPTNQNSSAVVDQPKRKPAENYGKSTIQAPPSVQKPPAVVDQPKRKPAENYGKSTIQAPPSVQKPPAEVGQPKPMPNKEEYSAPSTGGIGSNLSPPPFDSKEGGDSSYSPTPTSYEPAAQAREPLAAKQG